MSHRKVPDTSLAAYKQVHSEMKSNHYAKIMSTMRISGQPMSMEQIAEKLNWEVNKVSRRMSELEAETLVRKEGKGHTKSGRSCYLYVLVQQSVKTVRQDIADMDSQEFFTRYQNGEFENETKPTVTQTILFQ